MPTLSMYASFSMFLEMNTTFVNRDNIPSDKLSDVILLSRPAVQDPADDPMADAMSIVVTLHNNSINTRFTLKSN